MPLVNLHHSPLRYHSISHGRTLRPVVKLEVELKSSSSILPPSTWPHCPGRRHPGRHCLSVRAQLSPPRLPQSELTTSIFVAEIGKPPDVAQPNDLPGHRQHELHLVVPVLPFQGAILLRLFHGCAHWLCLSITGCTRDPSVHPTWKTSSALCSCWELWTESSCPTFTSKFPRE